MIKPGKDSIDLGVLVSDIEASLHFYRDLLGLAYIDTIAIRFGTLHRLRFGTSDFKLVEPNTMPPRNTTGLENQLGFRYVTFVVRNLKELCEKLRKEGVEFEALEREARPGVWLALVRDPDGNTVEFVERA